MKTRRSTRVVRFYSPFLILSILVSSLLPNSFTRASIQTNNSSTPNLVTAAQSIPGGSRTYTTNADFDEGTRINVVHSIPDQLQLDNTTRAFNFFWVAASGRGTVIKIDTTTGQILGEYYSAPQGRGRDPSRTTVDKDGNVWVGNRAERSSIGGRIMGSVVHLGLQENAQCQDRNGNGVIDTSTGLGDIRPWPNTNGVDNAGGVTTAQDECIIHYVRTNGANIRQVSVDGNNNVWVGGAAFGDTPRYFDLLDSQGNLLRSINMTTGADTGNEGNVVHCCYGGLVDPAGVLWSATEGGNRLLRIDPSYPNGSNDLLQSINLGRFSYGMGIDGLGNIWVSNWYFNTIQKISPAGVILGTFSTGGPSDDRGVVVTADNNIWIANSGGSSVSRLNNNGQFLAQVTVGREPTGVAVDAAGKVWSTNRSANSVSRIDPETNTVDMTVSLGSGALPYNYSDMTGSTLTGAPDEGTWTTVYDSGIAGAEWGSVRWTADIPGDGALLVSVASSEDGAAFGPEETAFQGADLSVANGRYLRIRVKFTRSSSGDSPILYDLTASTANQPPNADAGPDQVVDEGSVVSLDGTASYDPNDDPLTYTWELVSQSGAPVILSSIRTPDPSFLATDDGQYTFRLTVSDGRESDSDEVTVQVMNVAPSISPAVDQGYAGGLTLVTATFTDPGWVDLHTAQIDWGDGSPLAAAQVVEGAGWGSLFGSHVYAAAGSYAITIIVTDDDGGEARSQTITAEILEPYAVWANSTTASKALDWSGGQGWVFGRVHSNKDIVVVGNVKYFNGSTTYVGSLTVNQPNSYAFTPPAQKVSPLDFPFRYYLADFRPGGSVQQAVGDRYFDRSSECGADGFWHAENLVLPAGVYYVSCSAKLNGSLIGGSITLAAEGTIQVSGSRPAFEPFYDGLLFLSGSSANKSIDISASNSRFLGYIFSELGQIDISGADNRFYCGLLGDRVSLSASNLTLRASGCNRPPRTVAVTALVPAIDLSLQVDRSEAVPGDHLAYDLVVSNTGASLLVPGVVGAENADLADATLAYYAYVLEYFSVQDQTWLPLAGWSSALPGYTPTDPAPLSSGLSFQAAPNPASNVAYPASGDPLLGTVLQPGGLASWGYQALANLTPAQVTMLLDPSQVGGIRSVVRFEFTPADLQVRRLFRFGADFIQELRDLSGEMTEASVTLIPPAGDLTFFDASNTPALESIPPGASVPLSASFAVPAVAPRDPAETEAGYLARLQALDGASLRASAFALAQGGVGRLVAPEQQASTTQRLPILNLERKAPAAGDAGATLTFDLLLRNAGSAPATALSLEDTLAGSIDLPVTGMPSLLAPAEVSAAHSSYAVPADFPGGDLTGVAALSWQDGNGNPYGPLYSSATTAIAIAPQLSASKSDALYQDADGNGVPSAGDTLAYVVTLKNNSSGPAAGVRFVDTPGMHTQLVAGSVTTSLGAVTSGNSPGDASVQVDVGTLPGFGSAEIAFRVTIASPLPDGVTQVSNQGSLESQALPTVLTDDLAAPGAFDPTITPITQPGSSLGGSLSDFLAVDRNGSGAADPGDALRYELIVYNNGDGPTSGVSLSLAPDAYTTLIAGSVTTSQGAVVLGNGAGDTSLQVDLGVLAAGASVNIAFRLQIASALPLGASSISVQGSLTSNELEPTFTDDPEAPGDQDATTTPVYVPPPDLPAPSIGAVSPQDGAIVTAPVAIQAALEPPEGETITAWWVTYQRVGTSTLVEIARGTSLPPEPLLLAAAAAVPEQSQAAPVTLAVLDPTRLPNGTYILSVNAASSGGGVSSQSSSVVVDGELKLGRFLVTYQDLRVPLAGLPIRVLRRYDSYDKASGDFGIGWNVEVANFRVSTNRRLGEGGWQMYSVSCGLIFCITGFRTSIPHFVTVTWPDGRQEIFDLTPVNGSTFFPILTAAAFTGRPGTTSTLTPVGDSTLANFNDGNLYGGLFGSGGIYDPQQFLLTDKDGTSYLLDRTSGLVRLTDRNGNTLTVTRNAITSSLGPSVSFSRDSLERITQITGPDGEVLRYQYSPAGDLASFTDAQNRTFTYQYDNDHNLLVSSDPDGRPFQVVGYDADGRLQSVTDSQGNATGLSFDLDARQSIIESADGRLNTILTYDDWGNLIRKDQVFDSTTLTTLIDYDSLNRPVRITSPGGNISQAAYDDRNNLVQYVDPAGQAYHYTYDNRNQLIRLTNPNGVVEAEMSYDGRGNLTRLLQPGDAAYTYTYDGRGNLLTAADPSGRLEEFTYDANGYLLTYTNAADELTAYNHDASGNLLAITDAAGRTTQFGYDDQGNVLSVTDERGNVQRFTYNYWGSVTSYTDALSRQVTYQYDAGRRLTSATDRNGRSISYAYDAANRLIQRTMQSGEVTDIAYDPLGRVLSLVDSDARIEFSYDADSNLVSQRTLGAGTSSQPDVTLSYTYSPRRERLSMSGPGGSTSYTYDPAGQLTGLSVPGGRAYSFGYDPLGRLTSLSRPNGVTDLLQYSPAGDLLLRRSSLGAAVLAESAYTVYPTGQRASLANLADSLTFANNQVGWLVNVTSSTSGLLEAFTYDQVGNRTSWSGSPSTMVTYNSANHLLSDGRYLYTYDAEGNLTQRQERASGAITTFVWNEAGELLSIQHPDGSATRFRYDPLGRRIETDSAGTITRYVFDGPNAHLEYNALNQLSAIYTSGIAYDAMLSMTRSGSHYDYLQDGLGSTVALVDEAGDVIQSYTYDSSGAPAASSDLANPFTFTGREYEPRSGLYYFRGRYMDPWSGRFLSEDVYPTVNAYPYVHNAPLDYVDPSGWAATAEYAILSSDDEAEAAAEARLGASLADRAANLAKFLDRIAQNHRVVGVGRFFNPQTGETFTRVAVSSNRWSTALRGALNPGEAIRAFAGEHAEQALVRYAVQNGYQLRAVGASRHICDAICRPLLKGLGMIFGP